MTQCLCQMTGKVRKSGLPEYEANPNLTLIWPCDLRSDPVTFVTSGVNMMLSKYLAKSAGQCLAHVQPPSVLSHQICVFHLPSLDLQSTAQLWDRIVRGIHKCSCVSGWLFRSNGIRVPKTKNSHFMLKAFSYYSYVCWDCLLSYMHVCQTELWF